MSLKEEALLEPETIDLSEAFKVCLGIAFLWRLTVAVQHLKLLEADLSQVE